MNQKERMLAGLPYKAWLDGLEEERTQAKVKIREYNFSHPEEGEKREKILRDLLGSTGPNVYMEPPIYCDYGYNIEVGDWFYSNYNCTILDICKVKIGSCVMFAPNVSIYTAGHPIHHEPRNAGYEYGAPVTIGDNVWVGGNVVINPGVTIGNNVVIGSGSVVTKDIPDNVIAVGNPCKVIKEITEEDKKFYFKDKEFREDDY